jgi:hypothetical protein
MNNMSNEPATLKELMELPFTIHSLNTYSYLGMQVAAEYFSMSDDQIRDQIRVLHYQLVKELGAADVVYERLRPALTPQPRRREVAFVFDSSAAPSGFYGSDIAESWLPALRDHGPAKTAISHGDILSLSAERTWRLLDEHLVRRRDFPLMSTEQYYVVYFTNLSPSQLSKMDEALHRTSREYLGYVDATTWSPIKIGFGLPQYALRYGDVLITECDEDGNPNLIGFPAEDYGFRFLGISEEKYGTLLHHRIDRGVPEWADNDSAMSLAAFGGGRRPVAEITLTIDPNRVEYLNKDHPASMQRAGLASLGHEEVAAAISAKMAQGLIFNLRYTEGSRQGVRDPNLDALMFSTQVEFPDDEGEVRRYQLGIKYSPATHSGEVTTFF